MTGRVLGHYQVLEKLGEGGMGEVYRAADTKLGRDIALKVLPPALAQDPERLERFQREASVCCPCRGNRGSSRRSVPSAERMTSLLYLPRNARPPYQVVIQMAGAATFYRRSSATEKDIFGWA